MIHSLRFPLILITLGLLSAPSFAEDQVRPKSETAAQTLQPLAPGLTLPIEITHGLKAGQTKPGTPITGFTTQRIPVTQDTYLPRGVKVSGTVIASTYADKRAGHPAVLTLHFSSLRYRQQTVPLRTEALAIANFTDVDDTFSPASDPSDKGNPSPANWTTSQVGGDEIFRSGWVGPVCNSGMKRVGSADFYGVYADPPAGATGAAAIPRALGVFSTNAEGLYGFNAQDRLSFSGSYITVTSSGNLVLRSGDNLLLKVLPTR